MIYSSIDQILVDAQNQLFAEQAGLIGAIFVFMIFAIWLNKSLKRQVEKRTKDLEQSNIQLANANEQLQINDKLQKEFINIAAHELRTPIRPIMGIAELIYDQFNDKRKDKLEITKPEIDLIIRNALRLERLSSTLLQVAMIESQTLKLDKEVFNINEKIMTIVLDIRTSLPQKSDSNNSNHGNSDIVIYLSKELNLIFEPKNSPVNVYADS